MLKSLPACRVSDARDRRLAKVKDLAGRKPQLERAGLERDHDSGTLLDDTGEFGHDKRLRHVRVFRRAPISPRGKDPPHFKAL